MIGKSRKRKGFNLAKLGIILLLSLERMNLKRLYRNKLLLILAAASVFLTVLLIRDALLRKEGLLLNLQLCFWSWASLYLACIAQVLSERSGLIQAEGLLNRRRTAKAKLVRDTETTDYILVDPRKLNRGDIVLVETDDVIPLDGEVIEGIASVDESAITGESAPVLRESGGSRSAVTGGTMVVSDFIYVEITGSASGSFLDQMLGMVDDRARKKTVTEISLKTITAMLSILLFMINLTVFVIAAHLGSWLGWQFLTISFISILPITYAALLPAVSAAEMNRLVAFNVISKSVHMIESAGEISLMLLDKTGTITLGNRIAYEFLPLSGVTISEFAEQALISSHGDQTGEGKSITALAQSRYSAPAREFGDIEIIPFNPQTRVSGVNYRGQEIRKGAPDVIMNLAGIGKLDPGNKEFLEIVEKVARTGGTPLLVMVDKKILGVIHLKDVIKAGMKERFQRLRQMGIKTVMLTGDNPLTAAAIAAEAGVDDFVAEATPETKMAYIEKEQASGRMIAMCGDGTNDAPALAQADLGLVMNTGTQAARDAGNMLDLDSDPTKLIEIISIGRQLLVTKTALFIFTISSLVGKYLILLPVILADIYPELAGLNFMRMGNPHSVMLTLAILNIFLLALLTPFILQGALVKNMGPSKLVVDNLIMYGMGGLLVTLAAAKVIDLAITFSKMAV